MLELKEKLRNRFLEGTEGSIHFKLNPTTRGATDTYGSQNTNSPETEIAKKIASINSPAPSKIRTLPRDRYPTNIYKYALTKGTKGAEFMRENPVLNTSSDSEEVNQNCGCPLQKSKFAKH